MIDGLRQFLPRGVEAIQAVHFSAATLLREIAAMLVDEQSLELCNQERAQFHTRGLGIGECVLGEQMLEERLLQILRGIGRMTGAQDVNEDRPLVGAA
ncbi:hypothetical protein [Methanothrix soehngenii]|uniref:hypothetical protein n=1 Tax=Methanothrix soehngenii TaxID=2223 RepID=UPI00300D08CD